MIVDKISDLAKFGVMLVIYTGYMTWWASGVTFRVENNTALLHDHIVADAVITSNTITLAESIKSVQKQQEKNNKMLIETIETHAKCSVLMEAMMERLDRLEENRLHREGM